MKLFGYCKFFLKNEVINEHFHTMYKPLPYLPSTHLTPYTLDFKFSYFFPLSPICLPLLLLGVWSVLECGQSTRSSHERQLILPFEAPLDSESTSASGGTLCRAPLSMVGYCLVLMHAVTISTNSYVLLSWVLFLFFCFILFFHISPQVGLKLTM